ncbi:MAG: diguanylate cyclase, partial [Anaerolineales bacterium]
QFEKNLWDIRQGIMSLSQGDLSFPLQGDGVLTDALRKIQSHLRQLTTQAQLVAQGDYQQRASYPPEFAQAFNLLIEQMQVMARELEVQQDELIRRNDLLICEIEERIRTEQTEREQRQLAETIVAASRALNATLDLDEVMDIMLEKVADVVPYDSAIIMQVDGNVAYTRRAKNYHHYGKEIEQKVSQAHFNLEKTPNLRQLVTSQEPLVIPDVNQFAGWDKEVTGNPVQSWVGTPVIVNGRVIALFSLDKLEPGYYKEEHAQKLKLFAGHAALAIENARLYHEVRRLATIDALTGLYNRRYFFERGVQELERAQRYHHPLAIVMLDLDHFKRINDEYGHPAGDLVLATISKTFKSQLRQSDIAARFGGEEFIILLPETTLEQAEKIAQRLRQSIADLAIPYNDHPIKITASFGVSGIFDESYPRPAERVMEQIIAKSDEALYKAKQAGRNRVSTQLLC